MAAAQKKQENKDEAATDMPTTTENQEETFIAEVLSLHAKVGSGGSVTQAKVLLRHNNRTLIRPIYGPVRVGDLLQLRECVRESRRLR